MACHTHKEIAEKIKESEGAVARLLADNAYLQSVLKNHMEDASAKHLTDFDLPIYNIWKHFGNGNQTLLDNLLYLYTKPFDIVVDPFAGEGNTIDVCKKRLRRYYVSDRNPAVEREKEIRQHDIIAGLPNLHNWQDVKLVYLDFPHWKQAGEQYNEGAQNLAPMSLEEFNAQLSALINGLAKKLKQAYIALVIQPTQWEAPEKQFIDHVGDMLRLVKLPVDMRFSVPCGSQQCTPEMLQWAKENKRCLVLAKEIIVWRCDGLSGNGSTRLQLKLHKAAEQGHPQTQSRSGIIHGNGRSVPKDDTQAAQYYQKAAEQGDAEAQRNLGWMYEQGLGVSKDDAQAVHWYRKAAEQGDVWAQTNLGVMYTNGRGVPKDYTQAVQWYRKAAEQGYAWAQYNFGVMYENGDGVPQDDSQAVQWYQKAAIQKYAEAQYTLGLRYLEGRGAPKDDALALEWFQSSAAQGLAKAQCYLGWMYCQGRGVSKDYTLAVEWFRKAADQGFATAQFNLGLMYESGRGVSKDDVQAAQWLRKAAEQGYAEAQTKLGGMRTDT